MIDKLDLRIPRKASFTRTFARLYPELRAMEKSPFRPAKYYEYAGDLREFGFNLRLNLYCQMDKVGNHKIELIDVGEMNRGDICREVQQVFDIDPRTLGLMRVDFAVDIPKIPVSWFREAVRIEHKRFRAAVTGDKFYSEMGHGDIQTLYFGKRPNVIRIYDKGAEFRHQHQMRLRRWDSKDAPPTFKDMFGRYVTSLPLTRVERQIGGRMPEQIATLANVMKPLEFEPFAKLRIIDHDTLPERDPNVSFETHCTGMYLRSLAQNDGMQAVNTYISKHSNGNAAWARKKYASYLPSATRTGGLTESELRSRFAQSLATQVGA